jgi:hypothetical protein
MHTLVALILAAGLASLQASGPPSLPGGQAAGRPGGSIQVTAPVWKDAPPTMPPDVVIKEDAVMQLTCEGPWEIKYIQD